MRFNNPLDVGWQLHALDFIGLASTVFILIYSIRQYRRGRPTYLVLYLGCIAYGVMMELTTGMLLSRSYIQGEFTVMIETKKLLGYPTDMPLYVMIGFYPVIIFLGFKLVESFGIRSILARAFSAGALMLILDAPYIVNGQLPQVNWWTWLEWKIGQIHVFQFWYGWPMGDAWWELTFPSLMMYLVWRWEKRNQALAEPANVTSTPWKTLLLTPLVLGVLMNTVGLLISWPMGVFIGLDLPQFPLILLMVLASAAVLLYSNKIPVALDRAGWTLLTFHVTGYTAVTLGNFGYRPLVAGQITICLIALVSLVVLAAWPGRVARRADDREVLIDRQLLLEMNG